jgi:hypothetical protein
MAVRVLDDWQGCSLDFVLGLCQKLAKDSDVSIGAIGAQWGGKFSVISRFIFQKRLLSRQECCR